MDLNANPCLKRGQRLKKCIRREERSMASILNRYENTDVHEMFAGMIEFAEDPMNNGKDIYLTHMEE